MPVEKKWKIFLCQTQWIKVLFFIGNNFFFFLNWVIKFFVIVIVVLYGKKEYSGPFTGNKEKETLEFSVILAGWRMCRISTHKYTSGVLDLHILFYSIQPNTVENNIWLSHILICIRANKKHHYNTTVFYVFSSTAHSRVKLLFFPIKKYASKK